MPARNRISTHEAGYGWAHRQRRQALLDAHVDGTLCDLCLRPMYRSQDLHADHTDPRALHPESEADRLVHASCNTRRGALLGHRLRRGRRTRDEARPKPRALPQW